MLKSKSFLAIIGASLALSCCKEKEIPVVPTPEGPKTTYEFTRDGMSSVDFSGQTTRIAMFEALSNYTALANEGTELNENTMMDMFKNQNDVFADAELNASSKNMASKTYNNDSSIFYNYFSQLASTSAYGNQTASSGVAGIATNNDQTKQYLLDRFGIEHRQVLLKHLMGALLYYQATSVYLSELKTGNSVNNTDIVDGKNYTVMEHHFDEAFGYLGVPVDFPSNENGIKFYGKYAKERSGILNIKSDLMNAFIAGRQAIVNNDMAAKDAAILVIKKQWELIIAASAIHYLNEAITNFGDDAIRCHVLSECLGFVKSFKYNTDKSISTIDIENIEYNIGTNFYQVTIQDLNNAKDKLVEVFALEAHADHL